MTQGSGYTVPAGKNLLLAGRKDNPRCGTLLSSSKCFVAVSGSHTATTLNGGIAGPGDVLQSTSAAITITLRGVLVSNSVSVVLQDLADAGIYTAPATQSLYFHMDDAGGGCAPNGTINIGGFVANESGGILPAGQTLTNNNGCVKSLNGYLR